MKRQVKRQKDSTPITCEICGLELTAAGMPRHLYTKHEGMDSAGYVSAYGEFRQKWLKKAEQTARMGERCKICNQDFVSHKSMLQHLHKHNITWQEYFLKHYFNGIHPLCSCGCGSKVRFVRAGELKQGKMSYAREMLAGHNNNPPGYRRNTDEQKEKMRASAIERMKQGKGTFFTSGPSKGERKFRPSW